MIRSERELRVGTVVSTPREQYRVLEFCDEPNTGLVVVEVLRDGVAGPTLAVPTSLLREAHRSDQACAQERIAVRTLRSVVESLDNVGDGETRVVTDGGVALGSAAILLSGNYLNDDPGEGPIAPGECAAALSRMGRGEGNDHDVAIVSARLRELGAERDAANEAGYASGIRDLAFAVKAHRDGGNYRTTQRVLKAMRELGEFPGRDTDAGVAPPCGDGCRMTAGHPGACNTETGS